MNVCFFGIYDPSYARNAVLRAGFEQNGYTVIDCRSDPSAGRLRKFWDLYKEYRRLKHTSFDYVIVAFPGQPVVWLARLLFGKRIIFDAFLSFYDSNVFDRQLYGSRSLRAWKDWMLDWYSCRLARLTLVDTGAHQDYFSREFRLKREHIIPVPIGGDDTNFNPSQSDNAGAGKTIIHFHGSFIPLQGVPYIIRAAAKLRDLNIEIKLVGKGQMYDETEQLAENLGVTDIVTFVGNVPYTSLPAYIAAADICLGIFGDTDKTRRVVPNKLYECLAMGKPVITGDTPVVREQFTDGHDILLANVADGDDLAEKIRYLVENADVRRSIAQNGYDTFVTTYRPKEIIKRLLTSVNV